MPSEIHRKESVREDLGYKSLDQLAHPPARVRAEIQKFNSRKARRPLGEVNTTPVPETVHLTHEEREAGRASARKALLALANVRPPEPPGAEALADVTTLREGDTPPAVPEVRGYNVVAAQQRGTGADPHLYNFDPTAHTPVGQ